MPKFVPRRSSPPMRNSVTMQDLKNAISKNVFRWDEYTIAKYSDTKKMVKREDIGGGKKIDARSVSRSRSNSAGRRSTQSGLRDGHNMSPVRMSGPSMMRMSMRDLAEQELLK